MESYLTVLIITAVIPILFAFFLFYQRRFIISRRILYYFLLLINLAVLAEAAYEIIYFDPEPFWLPYLLLAAVFSLDISLKYVQTGKFLFTTLVSILFCTSSIIILNHFSIRYLAGGF